MNEDSEWWTAAVADMDTATVRRWCLDRAAAGVLDDWSWWDGVQVTTGWERARVAFIALAEVLEARQGATAVDPRRSGRGGFPNALRRLLPTT